MTTCYMYQTTPKIHNIQLEGDEGGDTNHHHTRQLIIPTGKRHVHNRIELNWTEPNRNHVDIHLHQDPINRQFLKSRNDIKHAVALTKDLLKVPEAKEDEIKNQRAEGVAAIGSAEKNALPLLPPPHPPSPDETTN